MATCARVSSQNEALSVRLRRSGINSQLLSTLIFNAHCEKSPAVLEGIENERNFLGPNALGNPLSLR